MHATTEELPSAARRRDLPRLVYLCLCIAILDRKVARHGQSLSSTETSRPWGGGCRAKQTKAGAGLSVIKRHTGKIVQSQDVLADQGMQVLVVGAIARGHELGRHQWGEQPGEARQCAVCWHVCTGARVRTAMFSPRPYPIPGSADCSVQSPARAHTRQHSCLCVFAGLWRHSGAPEP